MIQNAMSFLNNYEREDVSVIEFDGESTSIWGISPPAQEQMVNDLASTNYENLEFSVSILR